MICQCNKAICAAHRMMLFGRLIAESYTIAKEDNYLFSLNGGIVIFLVDLRVKVGWYA